MNTNSSAPVLQPVKERFTQKSRRPLSPEKVWRQEMLRLINENGVRRWLPSIPEFAEIRGKYLTGRAFFIEVDWKRRLLIGSLGWFDHPGKPAHPRMLRIPNGTLYRALWEIQKKIGQLCLDEGLYFRIIIDPSFAEETAFKWLWHEPGPAAEPAPPKPAVPSGPIRLTADIPYFLTRAPFPALPWTENKAYIRHLGEGKYFRVEPADGASWTDLPSGVLPAHLLDTLYNIARKTRSPRIAFYDAADLIAALGYAYGPDIRERLPAVVAALRACRITVSEPMYRKSYDISPLEACALWRDAPALIDKLGRHNPGRTDKSGPCSIYFQLSGDFIRWCDSQAIYEMDWELLNLLKTRVRQWSYYRKAVELGRRNSGTIPLGGPDGLLREFGYNVSEPAHYRKSKCRFREIAGELHRLTASRYGSAFACPHFVKGDLLYCYPWRPLKDHHHRDFPVPAATVQALKAPDPED